MPDIGYIKLYRKLQDWKWFQEPKTLQLFIYLLIAANYTEKEWKGIIVFPGQIITSVSSLSAATGQTTQSIRTATDRLKSTGEITIKTTNKYSVITIANWASYQSDTDLATSKTTIDSTNQQQTNNKPTTTTKEGKESKEGKNVFLEQQELPNTPKVVSKKTIPTIEDVRTYCKLRNNTVDAEKFIDYYTANGWMVGKNKMKDWQAAVRNWERNGTSLTGQQQQSQKTAKRDFSWIPTVARREEND